ncbi:MAG: EF-P lysine aminoacylase EpmA [Thermoanaerobaculia bacterium]|nr:EF-P lysine aminoacylase EpmA [Thermoanaerobaculia bacterium]
MTREFDRDWRPSASLDTLRRRAGLLHGIREFFRERGVLEVETPLLSTATVTDLHLHSLKTRLDLPGDDLRDLYLQTSPEFAMKRLLATSSGPIFQICKAFRDGEAGRRHNPEFTMLEWYRPGFDHHDLMDEMDAFLGRILSAQPAERLTYREVFERWAGLDPHEATLDQLASCARRCGIDAGSADGWDRDAWLHLILSQVVEPNLGSEPAADRTCSPRPTYLLDFPARQAALARIRPATAGLPPVAERFEVYVHGVELANGFHELTDPVEQRRRFELDLEERHRRGLPAVPLDEKLLAAMEHGLPACAGVAVGVDRLLMVQEGSDDLRPMISFDLSKA